MIRDKDKHKNRTDQISARFLLKKTQIKFVFLFTYSFLLLRKKILSLERTKKKCFSLVLCSFIRIFAAESLLKTMKL